MIVAGKILAGAVAAVAVIAAGEWELRRVVRSEVQSTTKQDSIVKQTKVHDSVYVVDTFKLRATRTTYDTLRRKVTLTDTVRVKEVLAAADSALKQCDLVISSCEQRVRDRDALIAELRKPLPQRRLTFPVDLLYDPMRQGSTLRAGAELRLVWGISARAEGQADQLPTGVRGAVRVGFRKTF